MNSSYPFKRAWILLPLLPLLAVALLPVKASASLLGDNISSGCVSIRTTMAATEACDPNDNLFQLTTATVDGTVEFTGASDETPMFAVMADFDTIGGIDTVTLTIEGNGGGATALAWDFIGLDWPGEPNGVIDDITLMSGTLGHTATPSSNALNFVTDAFSANAPQSQVLVFNLTTVIEDDDDDDDDEALPTPSSLLLLLAGLPLILNRRRR
jgi:hypothetical protein